MDQWEYGSVGVWISGCMDQWEYGSVGVWISGGMSQCKHCAEAQDLSSFCIVYLSIYRAVGILRKATTEDSGLCTFP